MRIVFPALLGMTLALSSGPAFAEQPLDEPIWLQNRIYFEADGVTLDSHGEATLTWLVAFARTYPDLGFFVVGHAADLGNPEQNLDLSARRAAVVRERLTVLGIAPDRLKSLSFGAERPASRPGGQGTDALNRRVEVWCDPEISPERAARLCRYLGDSPLNHDDGISPTYSIRDGKLVRNPYPYVVRDGKIVRMKPEASQQ